MVNVDIYPLFLGRGGIKVFLNWPVHSSEILHPIHVERLMGQFHDLYADRTLSQDRRVSPARMKHNCTTDTVWFLLFFPLLLMTLLLNIGLKYKLTNMLERMYNWRLCMYIQYVKKPLFLYFKCSKLIKSNNYHAIF